MRKVSVLATSTNETKEFMTDVKTWGELKSLIEGQGMKVAGMKAMERESRNTLEADGAILPTGDFVIFLTPGKMKSGK